MEDLLNSLVLHVTKDVFNLVSSDVKPSVRLFLSQAEVAVRSTSNTSAEYFNALFKIQSVLDTTWESLNTGHWSNVPIYLRHVYTLASFVKILAIIQLERLKCESENKSDALKSALKTADMGLLLGAPLPVNSCLCLTKVAEVLTSALQEANDLNLQTECKWNSISECVNTKSWSCDDYPQRVKAKTIPRLQRPSMEKFMMDHFYKEMPVILTDCIGHWPALTRWQDSNYIRRVAGARLVPVELGAKYTDQSWSQKLMTVSEFIDTYVRGTKGTLEETGYLAQHPLFDQVPELLSDIREPEYCCLSNEKDKEEPTVINAWFGPAGTVSPLHYDPKHNLLAQVVGTKHVYLYPPEESDFLYPHEDRLLANTARVDPENPNYIEHPRFREASAWGGCLESGQMLYIPPRWWHHVRATAVSFSVSFWWM